MFAVIFVNTCGMKRFLITTLLIAVIVGVMLYFVPQSKYADVRNYAEYNATVNIYCRATTLDSIDMGLGRQVTCSVDDFRKVVSNCNQIDGVSVSFNGSVEDVNAIINRLHATTVSVQQLDGLYVACCVSNRLQGGVTLDGKRVNLQIAYSAGTITVGYPLILGSY